MDARRAERRRHESDRAGRRPRGDRPARSDDSPRSADDHRKADCDHGDQSARSRRSRRRRLDEQRRRPEPDVGSFAAPAHARGVGSQHGHLRRGEGNRGRDLCVDRPQLEHPQRRTMSVRPLRARDDRAGRRRGSGHAGPSENAVLHRERSAPAGGGLRRRRQAGRRVREPLEGCARGDVPRGGPRQPDDSLSRPVGPRQHRPCHQAQLDAAGRRRGRRGRRRHEGPPPAAGCSEGAAGPDGRTRGDEHERPRFSRSPRSSARATRTI